MIFKDKNSESHCESVRVGNYGKYLLGTVKAVC
jgi:hypothetical protein